MKDFFYDELNKELEINANLDEDAGTISGTLTNDSNSQLTGNLNESQDITECIYGKLNNLVELQEYKGWTSETIEVIVDNKYHIIKANLLAAASFASKEYVDEKIKILRQYTDEQLNKVNVNIDNLVLKTDETNRQVNQIKLDLSSLDESLQKEIQDRTNAINTEATTRKEEDDKLAQSISDETNARIEQDTVLLNSINSEIEERNKADASLQDKIDKESETRKTADQALRSGIDSNLEKINQEIQDRTNADNTLQSNIDNLSNTKLDKSNANRNVLTETELTYDGDNVYSKHDYVNLATSEENTQEYLFKLATDTTAGLMATADYKSIRDLQARVQNLEAKTTRLLYTDKTNPTVAEINAFVIGEGYTSPFEGIAVVVAGTYHIWHFYEGGVGWKDDGADTVTNFTNTTSGTILGSATDGKVYAETEGTGSVYGWGQLKARVTNNETNLDNTNSKLDAEIKRSTETDEAQDTSIQDLQSQITSNDEDIANLENTKATKEALNSAVSTLTTNINNVNTELSQQLQTEVTTRENADNKLTETIESIWSSTDTSGSAQVAIAEEQRARIAEDNRIANLLTTETSSRIDADSNLQNQINTLDTNIDRNVVTATGFTYNGDNVVSTHTKTNLKTGLETQESHTFNLANQTTAGLMSTEDVKTLSDLQARVGNLENKTTRLWYSGVENPTASDINTFVTNLGYTSPFEGIAVVVEMPNGSHHIWHYYEGNIGWRDDGVDTVSLFTSENPGIVLGSIGTTGKIFAESDGTASVIGWDELKNKVSTNESNISTNTTNINSLQVNSATKEELQQAIQQEIEARTSADNTLQENINKKLDKTTDAGYRVYISNNNVNTTVAYSSNANINSMVYRDANGRSKIQNPIDDLDIANKKYVDENGGKIDTISINGTTQEIVNKNVDVDIPIIDIKFKDVSIVNDRIVDIPSNISNFTNDADYADKTYVNTYGGKIDTIKIDNTLLPITDKNIDIPIGSSSTFGVLKSNTSGIISTNGVLDLDDTVIKDNNVSTKVQSIVGQQSTLTTTSKTLVGAVNELDVDLSTLTSRVDNLNALRILNKGVIESTEANVQTVATNYIKTNYNRDPQNNDGLIITITDKNNDKVIYAYSSFSSTWISAGINQFDVADGTYTEKGIVSVAQNAGIKVDAGVLSLDPTYLSNNYLTISTDQTVSGKKLFVNAQQKVADSDYRGVLTTPLTTVDTKQYLLGQTKSTGDLKTNTNLSVYMQSGKLYSNNSEVLNISSNQTIIGEKTFTKEIIKKQGSGYSGLKIYNTSYGWDTKPTSSQGMGRFIIYGNDGNWMGYLQGQYESSGIFSLQLRAGSNKQSSISLYSDNTNTDSDIITMNTNVVRPYSTGVTSLGSSSYKWKDLYLSGNLSDGTNNITVAELTKHVTIDTEQDLSAYKDFLEGLGISNTFKLKKLTGETSQTAVDCRTIDDGIYYLPKSTYFYVNTNSVTTLGEGFVIVATKTNGGTGKYWFYFGERSSQPTIMKGYLTSTSGNYSIIQTEGFVRTNSTTTQNISCSSSTNKSVLNLTGRSGNGTYLDFTNFENGVGKTCSIGINGNFEPSFIDKDGNEKSFGGITLRRWTD